MNLDNLNAIKKLDSNQVAESIANLPRQLLNAWQLSKKIKLPATYNKHANLIFCGMGGSNLASEIIRDVFGGQIKTPFVLVRNYNLPAFADKNTLVIIDSYSGNTEETIACLEQALKKKCKIICLASGGKIQLLAKKHKLPYLQLDPQFNPSNQPRYDIGSQLGAVLAIMSKLKIIKINDAQITAIAKAINTESSKLLPTLAEQINFAKQLAQAVHAKNIYLVGAEHLSANAHILANQINESAKQLATPHKIPELNHHFLEATAYPKKITSASAFIFLFSKNYGPRIIKRFQATKKILDKRGIKNFAIVANGQDPLQQALSILTQGGWLSFYLAMLNNANPAEIPWVEYFKKELDK